MRQRLRLWIYLLVAIVPALGLSPAVAQNGDPSRIIGASLHRGGRETPRTGVRSAFADAEPRYHNGADVVCSDCHIAHASASHLRNPSAPGPNETVPYTAAPSAMLLRAADPLDLCLTCHDNQAIAPDVVGADVNGLVQRSAGHFGEPEDLNPMGHDLGRGLPKAGTGRWDFCYRCHFSTGEQRKVTCIDCHRPHGNGLARNLAWPTEPDRTPELGLFTNPTAAGMARYEEANVSYGTLNSNSLREVTNVCIDCHHVFTGGWYRDPEDNDIHNRHPSYESERADRNSVSQGDSLGTTVSSHWVGGSGSGFAGTTRVRVVQSGATSYAAAKQVDREQNGVFCLTCHRAHGSDRPFGLTFVYNPGNAASKCDQCHLKQDVTTPEPQTARIEAKSGGS